MHVDMEYRLPSGQSDIYADIKPHHASVRFFDLTFSLMQQIIYGVTLRSIKVKVVMCMAPWDNESMHICNRKFVKYRNCEII